jgi:outer membrane lipopolysaccharide assembly protein LptE/RlpB
MCKEIRLRMNFEKELLLNLGDSAVSVYLNDRDYFEENLKILVKTNKCGIISKEDYEDLLEEAKPLLPKRLIIK